MLLTLFSLCVILILSAAIGGFFALAKNPPVIKIDIGLKPVQAPIEAPSQPPLPVDILEYIEQESEEHARQTRKGRARSLFTELQNWDAVFRTLQREDAIE